MGLKIVACHAEKLPGYCSCQIGMNSLFKNLCWSVKQCLGFRWIDLVNNVSFQALLQKLSGFLTPKQSTCIIAPTRQSTVCHPLVWGALIPSEKTQQLWCLHKLMQTEMSYGKNSRADHQHLKCGLSNSFRHTEVSYASLILNGYRLYVHFFFFVVFVAAFNAPYNVPVPGDRQHLFVPLNLPGFDR